MASIARLFRDYDCNRIVFDIPDFYLPPRDRSRALVVIDYNTKNQEVMIVFRDSKYDMLVRYLLDSRFELNGRSR